MNRFFSILLSLTDELFPSFRPSNKKGFISFIFIITANSVPIFGIILFKWNPYIIILIYWGESLIIGIFNLLKMLISGSIQNHKFSPSGCAGAAGLGAFFTIHYGMFMFVHGVFIIIFMMISLSIDGSGSSAEIDPFSVLSVLFPENMTAVDLFESEFSAIAALFITHLISFYMYFIKTGEYNYTEADTYMARPYKRIIIMHLTILFGAFTLFLTGFKSIVFIIIWIGLKVFSDLRLHISELKKYHHQALPKET